MLELRFVSCLKVTERGRAVYDIISSLFEENETEVMHEKLFFENMMQWLHNNGWEIDVSSRKRKLLCEALAMSHANPTLLFSGWMVKKKAVETIIPIRKNGKLIPKTRNVLDICDIWDDDRALFQIAKNVFIEEKLDEKSRKTFYNRIFFWLQKRGWFIPEGVSFGLHIIAAIDRQCVSQNTDSRNLIESSIRRFSKELRGEK